MSHIKAVKDKPREFITIVNRILLYFIKLERPYLVYSLLKAASEAVLPFTSIILPAFIIEELMGGRKIGRLVGISLGIILFRFVLEIICSASNRGISKSKKRIDEAFRLQISQKASGLDYQRLADNRQIEKMRIVKENLERVGGITEITDLVFSVVKNALAVVLSVILVSALNMYIIVLAAITILIHTYIQSQLKKIDIGYWNNMVGYNMRFFYIVSVILNRKFAQDIRLYNARQTFNGQMESFVDYIDFEFANKAKKQAVWYALFYMADVLQQLCVYAYLAYMYFLKRITMGRFTMYISTVQTFTTSAGELMTSYLELAEKTYLIAGSFHFLDLAESDRVGTSIPSAENYQLQLKNVSFKYPGQNRYAVKNVSLTISPGEKICIAGMNGSGKSTLVKLIMRLYEPTEGEILLNGHDIREYQLEEYYRLFSPVFQDFEIFDSTIYENIKLDTGVGQEDDLDEAASMAGLYEKICSLEKGSRTHISKQFYADGIELSGGDAQKLAIARAFYKNAPIFILDEPTAALDPKTESEIFERVNDHIYGKTTVYVSHRMASCLFSDRIVVMHGGELIELGTHEELYARNGKYAEMFRSQAQYYIYN